MLRNVLMYLFPVQKPDSIVDACQALSKARELRAQFEKKEKPLITAKVEIQITSKVEKLITAKGRHPQKKFDYFRALPELAPPPPNSGNLVLFSGRQNDVLRV